MNYLRFLFTMKVVPTLYLIVLWGCLSVGAGIFLNDLERGVEIASAFSLFYIVRGYYYKELYGIMQNAKSNEA